jgi:hypothetical protein
VDRSQHLGHILRSGTPARIHRACLVRSARI